jgi:hypothetical protein
MTWELALQDRGSRTMLLCHTVQRRHGRCCADMPCINKDQTSECARAWLALILSSFLGLWCVTALLFGTSPYPKLLHLRSTFVCSNIVPYCNADKIKQHKKASWSCQSRPWSCWQTSKTSRRSWFGWWTTSSSNKL